MTKPDFSDVWGRLVRDVWFDYHPDRNPCEHDNYSVCVQCLQNLFDQYPDWDGHGANPVNAESFLRVRDFVMKLPDDVEKPGVVPEPDGDVVMVWTKDGRHVCIVGIEPTGLLEISVLNYDDVRQAITLYGRFDLSITTSKIKQELYKWLQAAYAKDN
jgi:hypothetical protein